MPNLPYTQSTNSSVTPKTVASERAEFLNSRWWPARIPYREAGWILGFSEVEVALLVSYGLLKPLGEATPNSAKLLFTRIIREHSEDAQWMERASKTIKDHWRSKNAKAVAKKLLAENTLAQRR
jgi:hypothetical protein